MTFVHPLLLGGLLLVGIPVLIHLIMQQKPKHLLFPAFRFLVQKHRTNLRQLRLRHLLLLALRMLLIALICLALARPKLFSERIGVGSERPVAAVLLFDTSFSMDYRPTPTAPTRLEEAKQRALELLDELPDGSRVAVLDSGEPGGEWLLTAAQATDRVKGLKPRPNAGPVTRSLSQAYRLFNELEQQQEAGPDPLPRFLYVFSDRTPACWDGNDVKNHKPPEQINAAFVDVGVGDPWDAAVVSPELPEPLVAPGDTLEIRATVQAVGMPCDTVLSCQIDNETDIERKPVKLQPGQSEVVLFRRPVKHLSAGPHLVRLRLESGDPLPFNNECYAAFEVRAGRSVLVLTDSVKEAGLLKAALEVRGFRVEVLPVGEAHELAPNDLLAKYPAVCLLSVAEPTAGLNRELWAKLHGYVQKGGGLAVIPGGDDLRRDAYNGEAARQVLPGELVGIVATEKKADVPWNEGGSSHPLMVPFREWRKKADVDFQRDEYRPRADRYWEVKPYEADSEIVVRYADEAQQPALLERRLGQGRVLLFTVPLDRQNSGWHNYWNESSFGLVLADKALGYLAGDAERPNFNYVSGTPVTVALPPEPFFPSYTLIGPGLSGSEASVQRTPGQNNIQITQAVMPGQFTLYDSKGTRVACFAVNVRGEESQLDNRVPAEQIEAVLGPGSVVTVTQGANLRDALQGRWLQPLELFPWLMIALLLLLAVENLLGNKFYRRPPQEQEEQKAA
jgi:hypothetical protein